MDPTILTKARRHLARRDPVLKQLIGGIGACTLRTDDDRFGMLVRSIVSQQISTHAARAISGRLYASFARTGVTPLALRRARDERLRKIGLSANKVLSLRDLAERVHRAEVPLADLHLLEDEAVIDKLVPVRGIGRWTAQMFLIFALGRPDVLPVDDFGLRAGVKRHYGLADMPNRAELTELAEPWRPYRSVATWYLWRTLGNVPQSD
jgi:DNA-3-methyladenine glycosylase II